MRPAGRFVAAVLTELTERTRAGINVLELDRIAHAMIREHRATSCYIGYHPSFGAMPFGKVLCVSVNDAVLHGLPRDRRLRDGDLVSLDFAAEVDGWVADSSMTISGWDATRRGPPPDRGRGAGARRGDRRRAARQPAGRRLGGRGRRDPGAGYQVNTAFGGHGVGRVMHGPPDVPNDGVAGRGLAVRPGLVIAIEPWFLAGSPKIVTDRDGWTIRSVDRSRGVHVEHTVAGLRRGRQCADARRRHRRRDPRGPGPRLLLRPREHPVRTAGRVRPLRAAVGGGRGDRAADGIQPGLLQLVPGDRDLRRSRARGGGSGREPAARSSCSPARRWSARASCCWRATAGS